MPIRFNAADIALLVILAIASILFYFCGCFAIYWARHIKKKNKKK